MPSPGGQISGMGACHPDDLPEGYHADARGQSLRGRARLRRGLPTGNATKLRSSKIIPRPCYLR